MTKIFQSPILILLFVLLLLTAVLNSCSSGKKTLNLVSEEISSSFLYMPEGIAIVNSDTVSVGSFWVSKYELTNAEYSAFLTDLKSNSMIDEYRKALPDTTQWEVYLINGALIGRNYHRGISFRKHPAVNISHEAAKLYCEWLTEKYNQESGKNERYVFRLPTYYEWLRVAQAGADRPYSWDSNSLCDQEGNRRAKYKHVPNRLLSLDRETNEVTIVHHEAVGGIYKTDEKRVTGTNVTIARAVDSYSPGISGTYNMNGNVAEMIEEKGIALGGSWNCLGYDIRNTAILEYDGPKPFVGFRIIMTVDTGD